MLLCTDSVHEQTDLSSFRFGPKFFYLLQEILDVHGFLVDLREFYSVLLRYRHQQSVGRLVDCFFFNRYVAFLSCPLNQRYCFAGKHTFVEIQQGKVFGLCTVDLFTELSFELTKLFKSVCLWSLGPTQSLLLYAF